MSPSIWKYWYGMKVFRCFKFISGIFPLSLFNSRNSLLRYWSLCGATGRIALSSALPWALSLTALIVPNLKFEGMVNSLGHDFWEKGSQNFGEFLEHLNLV